MVCDVVPLGAGPLPTAVGGPLLASIAGRYRDQAILVVLTGTGAHGSTMMAATKKTGAAVIAEAPRRRTSMGCRVRQVALWNKRFGRGALMRLTVVADGLAGISGLSRSGIPRRRKRVS